MAHRFVQHMIRFGSRLSGADIQGSWVAECTEASPRFEPPPLGAFWAVPCLRASNSRSTAPLETLRSLSSLDYELAEPGQLNTAFSSDIPSYRAGPRRLKDTRLPPILPSVKSALARAGH